MLVLIHNDEKTVAQGAPPGPTRLRKMAKYITATVRDRTSCDR